MSCSKPSTVPDGSFEKASSLGAKTVKGPGLLRASTRPAALTAVTRVLNEPAETAVSTMLELLFMEYQMPGFELYLGRKLFPKLTLLDEGLGRSNVSVHIGNYAPTIIEATLTR